MKKRQEDKKTKTQKDKRQRTNKKDKSYCWQCCLFVCNIEIVRPLRREEQLFVLLSFVFFVFCLVVGNIESVLWPLGRGEQLAQVAQVVSDLRHHRMSCPPTFSSSSHSLNYQYKDLRHHRRSCPVPTHPPYYIFILVIITFRIDQIYINIDLSHHYFHF